MPSQKQYGISFHCPDGHADTFDALCKVGGLDIAGLVGVFIGGAVVGFLFNVAGPQTTIAQIPWYDHLVLGGFCFGAVFMATDPVTSCRTEKGKYIYGFLIGALAITIRVLNPGYPEGMMLAILFMNVFAPTIDYCFVNNNINKRLKRAK